MVELEINDKKVLIPEGSMIIEAADKLGVYIPRFCYHSKLSIAANCRMCLVEVEKVGKPLPACATPVTPGMKVFTQSKKALAAQRSVMEFLLINHPLDCPICDQGGECELQDLSMGFGHACSSYEEPKRSVASEDIGPLIETWMTRCIQCTRCVRFGEEIAGLRELGATGRGEQMEIGTYVQHFLQSELSGNIIDICPVGALTNKPARYSGRSWEYREHPSVAPHDCVGSNIFVHTRSRQLLPQRVVMRAVPRENEAVNETWASDRDRFSVHGLYHESRVYQPRIKKNGQWVETDWERALLEIADRTLAIVTQQGADQVAGLAAPQSTVEECYLLQKMLRALGSNNVDHRLHEQDFSTTAGCPSLGMSIADIEQQEAILLVGANSRFDQPLINHRIRKAALDQAAVMALASTEYPYNFPLHASLLVAPTEFTNSLLQLLHAVAEIKSQQVDIAGDVVVTEAIKNTATQLCQADKAAIFLGAEALQHQQAGLIRQLVQHIADLSGAKFGVLTPGANSVGAHLAGMLPHTEAGLKVVNQPGLNAKQLLTDKPVRAYFLLNFEPEYDCAYPHSALAALNQAGLVVCLTPFATPEMNTYADFILPIAPFTETAGTFVNAEARWQSFSAATVPAAAAKPAWKVLRVLANFLQLDGFQYKSADEVRDELHALVDQRSVEQRSFTQQSYQLQSASEDLMRLAPWHMYRCDSLTRRSMPLQQTLVDGLAVCVINQRTADRLGLQSQQKVIAQQGDSQIELPLSIDNCLADNAVLIPSGLEETQGFGQAAAPVTLQPVR